MGGALEIKNEADLKKVGIIVLLMFG